MEDKGPLETLPLQSIAETSCHHIVSSVVVVAVVVLGIGRTEPFTFAILEAPWQEIIDFETLYPMACNSFGW
jgi:hypothetical protein